MLNNPNEKTYGLVKDKTINGIKKDIQQKKTATDLGQAHTECGELNMFDDANPSLKPGKVVLQYSTKKVMNKLYKSVKKGFTHQIDTIN